MLWYVIVQTILNEIMFSCSKSNMKEIEESFFLKLFLDKSRELSQFYRLILKHYLFN